MEPNKKPFYASASSIKLFLSCSLKYYYSKILKIPEKTNNGALQGSAAHTVLECLLKPRHKEKFEKISEHKTIKKCKVTKRYVLSYIKKVGLPAESFERIDKFIVTGVNFDFFCQNGEIVGVEIPFEIGSEEDGYFLRGFIDKLVVYEGWHRVIDYKSSKKLFSGKDLEENLQGFIYALAVKKLYPEYNLKKVVDFLFLAFPEGPLQRFPVKNKHVSDEILSGFEEYIKDIYTQMANFRPADRWKNVAANNNPPDDGSFGGKLLCGFAKQKNQIKKDGQPYYHCPYRFDQTYYALIGPDGEISKTAFEKKDLVKKKGYKIKKLEFAGCERFIRKNP